MSQTPDPIHLADGSELSIKTQTSFNYFRFLFPSLLGILFFLVPFKTGDHYSVFVIATIDYTKVLVKAWLPAVLTVMASVSVLAPVLLKLSKKPLPAPLAPAFKAEPLWMALRVTGWLVCFSVLFDAGPEWLRSEDTGGNMVNVLAPTLLLIFFFTPLMMPVLTDYGFMEFMGTLLGRSFKFIFGLPGRSAIDCLASWLSAASIGVIITSRQYAAGYYSKREATVIATNFSVVSLPFCYVIADVVHLDHLFLPFYVTVMLAGFVLAVIVPRIPPLSRIPDSYHGGQPSPYDESVAEGRVFQTACQRGAARAATAPGLVQYFKNAGAGILDLYIGLMPVVIAVTTIALIFVEYTPFLDWLSYPLIPLLELMQIPQAAEAAPTVLLGFADMFLPALVIEDFNSELTRFVIAGLSVTQLVYMSEVGILLMRSAIAISFKTLLLVFLVRTALALPIMTLIGHWMLG